MRKVTKTQMQNYIGLCGTIKRLEEQILGLDETAARCTSNVGCDNTAQKTENPKKLENCVVSKTALLQQLEECRNQVAAVDDFLHDLRLEDAVTALAMEFYYFTPMPVSFDTISRQLSRYVPSGRAPTGSGLQKRFERLLAADSGDDNNYLS